MKPFTHVFSLLLLAHAALLSACGPREVTVRSGTYRIESAAGRPDTTLPPSLVLDVNRETETLRLLDGTNPPEIRPLIARPLDRWVENCATQTTSRRLEVLDLGGADLTLDALTLQNPVLTASCSISGFPEAILLGEGGTGPLPLPCGEGVCLFFRKES